MTRPRMVTVRLAAWFALVLGLALATGGAAQGAARLQPEPGFSDVYRIRLSTYSGENQMPLLIIALEYRDTALEDGRRQIDILRAERYEPFGGIWLPSVIDSVSPAQDNLPEGVQMRVLVDRDSPIAQLVPDDIPDLAFGLVIELVQIVRAQMDPTGVGALSEVGDAAALAPFTVQWNRSRTNSSTRRTCAGGEARFESMEENLAQVRWAPQTIRWSTLQVGSPNQMVVSEEEHVSLLTINAQTGALVSAKTEKDTIRTTIVGPVNHAQLPAWEDIVRPPDAALHVTHRFIEVQRLEDFLAEEQRRKEGDTAPAGPPQPGSGE